MSHNQARQAQQQMQHYNTQFDQVPSYILCYLSHLGP